ncbi:MAG: DUF4184 family protein [Nitrospira sp.]|nr:DUF4184 family protein [Nitrospira sp.]MDH5349075.1 DUF4184 family protein [Nitrospira sp.]MDH5499159.1 DUF4184 family protein [Nitrospira sp.]
MPFTPFHMGAALIVKPAAQKHLSLITFGVAQIAMDIEPFIGMLRNSDILHGPTHTVLGAIVIGLLVALVSPSICRPILRRYNQEVLAYKLRWLSEPPEPTRLAIWSGAFGGTLSHVVLDSVMHYDMRPLAPFSDANPILNVLSHDGVYQLCFMLGLVGCMGCLLTKWLGRQAS